MRSDPKNYKFGSLFPDSLDRRIYETKFPTQVSLFFLLLLFPFLLSLWSSLRRSKLAFSRTIRYLNSQNSLLLGKLYCISWLVLSLNPREMLITYVVFNKAEKHVPKGELDGTTRCVTRYSRGVALTEIIITELNCIYRKPPQNSGDHKMAWSNFCTESVTY